MKHSDQKLGICILSMALATGEISGCSTESQKREAQRQLNQIEAVENFGRRIQREVLEKLPPEAKLYKQVNEWEKQVESMIEKAGLMKTEHSQGLDKPWFPWTYSGYLKNEGEIMMGNVRQSESQLKRIKQLMENLKSAMDDPKAFVERILAIQKSVNEWLELVKSWQEKSAAEYDSPDYRQKYSAYIQTIPNFPNRASFYDANIKSLENLKAEIDGLVLNSQNTLKTNGDEVNAMNLVENQKSGEKSEQAGRLQKTGAESVRYDLDSAELQKLEANIAEFWAQVECHGRYEQTETPLYCSDHKKNRDGECREETVREDYDFSLESNPPFSWETFQKVQAQRQKSKEVVDGIGFFSGGISIPPDYLPLWSEMNLPDPMKVSFFNVERGTYRLNCTLQEIQEKYGQKVLTMIIPPVWSENPKTNSSENRATDQSTFLRDNSRVGKPVEHKPAGFLFGEKRAWHQISKIPNGEFPIE